MKKEKKVINEAEKENPRIKSLQLAGARLAIRLARQIKSSNSLEDLVKLSSAQSTVCIGMQIVKDDFQRANRLFDMARSIANDNPIEGEENGQ